MASDRPFHHDPGPRLTHLDDAGAARMVDVGGKPLTRRRAVAEALLRAAPATLDRIVAGDLPKGEAIAVARIAGIQAAKRCDELIPLCHGLPLDAVDVEIERTAPETLRVVATARTVARTGVEMEALTAAAVAALTLYDMTKAIDRGLVVDGLRLLEKTKHAVDGDESEPTVPPPV